MASPTPRAASSLTAKEPDVIVLQVGARLHYAVPAAYARANALRKLYTDACASVAPLSVLRGLTPASLRPPSLRRLLGRVLPPEIPRDRVQVATVSTLLEHVQARLGRRSTFSAHASLRKRVIRQGFQEANCLYCLDNHDLPLMRAARDAGLAVMYEQIICPTVGRILREERTLFPNIEAQDSESLVEAGIARDIEAFRVANAVVCGSEFVRADVASLAGPSIRASVVPYGVNEAWLKLPRSPVPGRILFVGAVGLRKGSHYLAEATRLLAARRVPCEVRVVGPYDSSAIARPEFRGPTYVGQVPRERISSEFARADIFVLPSIAEGSAMVHLEALACGLPVVTTPNAGSHVRDRHEGFIVPIRDAKQLAERLEELVYDRDLRARMSRHASQRAAELSWRHFGDRLVAVTRDALQHCQSRRSTERT